MSRHAGNLLSPCTFPEYGFKYFDFGDYCRHKGLQISRLETCRSVENGKLGFLQVIIAQVKKKLPGLNLLRNAFHSSPYILRRKYRDRSYIHGTYFGSDDRLFPNHGKQEAIRI